MKRAIHLTLHLAPFLLTLFCVAWVTTQSPFAAPFVERSNQQLKAALTRAMAREITPQWMRDRAHTAILEENLFEIEMLKAMSEDYNVPIPQQIQLEMDEIVAAQSGYLASALSCGECAFDISSCPTLSQIGMCAVPFEMTPAGDLNALRRAGAAYLAGSEVDQLDVGLAVVGLGATGAVIVSGGSSYTLKAGTSLMRMARRLGALTPLLAGRLTGLMRDAVRWDRFGDFARLRIGPAELVDSAKLGELANIGGSLNRVAESTSIADTMLLMRHVDTAEDAARLARVSEAAGPKTRGIFEVLGKSRVMRATIRLSDLAVGAAVAMYALAMQILIFCGQQCGNICLRSARHLTKAKPI